MYSGDFAIPVTSSGTFDEFIFRSVPPPLRRFQQLGRIFFGNCNFRSDKFLLDADEDKLWDVEKFFKRAKSFEQLEQVLKTMLQIFFPTL